MLKKGLIFILLLSIFTPLLFGASFFKNKYYPENIKWIEVKTEHFRILYMQGHEYLLPLTAQFSEDAYDFNNDIFTHEIDNPIYLILYPSPQMFSQTQLVPAILPPNVGGFATFKKDRVVIPFNGDVTYFRELIYHEVSHIFQYHAFLKNPLAGLLAEKMSLPTWIFEGLSEHAAGDWKNPKWMVLKDAVLYGRIHDPAYFEKAGTIDYLGYQEAHSLVSYLYTHYPEYQMDDFLKELNMRLDIEEALKTVYGLDFPTLYHRWRETLNSEVQAWASQRPTLFSQETRLFPQGTLFVFPGEHFYITAENGSLVRRIIDDDEYREILYTPSPFTLLLTDRSAMSLSQDRGKFAFVFYKNSRYHTGIYDFFTRTVTSVPLPDVTDVKRIFYHNGRLHLLAKEGMKAAGFILQGKRFQRVNIPVDQADAWVKMESDDIFFNTVGGQTYLHDGNRIFSVDGALLSAAPFSEDSIFLLLIRGKDNILCHYNRKDHSFQNFTATRETVLDFGFTDHGLVRYIYADGRIIPALTPLPQLGSREEGPQVYSAPDLTDAVYYDTSDFEPENFVDTLTLGGLLYGVDITENKYVRLSTGMAMDSILNENQLFFVMGYHVNGSGELDFGLYYRRSGNRPSYLATLEKSTVHRNGEEYNLSQLSGQVLWPFSLTESMMFQGGARLEGFLGKGEETRPYAGLAYVKDTAYGRLYPDYGIRAFLYGGLTFGSETKTELQADVRFYFMPFMLRLFYQDSPSSYRDDNYLRGYRETYFPSRYKLMANMEVRSPMIWILPGWRKPFQLPPLSLFLFGDMGLFTDDLSKVTWAEEGHLADPLASFGYGVTLHLGQNMNLDMTFSHKTDLKEAEKRPVLEFSINKLFY